MGERVESDGQGNGRCRKVVLCDIDHVISDAFWRDPMIGGSWDEYHAASIEDRPVQELVELLRCLRHDYDIIGMTARPEKWRKLTLDWLLIHNVPMISLLMRPDQAFHPAPEIKVKLVQENFEPEDIAFILEDRDDVVAAFKAIGITALQVHAIGRAR